LRCPYCGAETTAKRCEYCDSDISYIYGQDGSPDTTESVDRNTPWNSQPQTDSNVWHEAGQNAYTEIPFPAPSNTEEFSNRRKTNTLLLCIFLGWLGVHHFYTGKWVWGLIYLFTHGFWGFGVVIDLIMIATDKYTDKNKKKLLK